MFGLKDWWWRKSLFRFIFYSTKILSTERIGFSCRLYGTLTPVLTYLSYCCWIEMHYMEFLARNDNIWLPIYIWTDCNSCKSFFSTPCRQPSSFKMRMREHEKSRVVEEHVKYILLTSFLLHYCHAEILSMMFYKCHSNDCASISAAWIERESTE